MKKPEYQGTEGNNKIKDLRDPISTAKCRLCLDPELGQGQGTTIKTHP